MSKIKNKDLIKIVNVPALLYEITGVTRTRATVYLWATKGRQSKYGTILKLRTVRRLNQLYTTRKWVENFIRDVA